jgi:outer membrane receptor protein involved in Fe transport
MCSRRRAGTLAVAVLCLSFAAGRADAAEISGTVRDETGGSLPGVTVEFQGSAGRVQAVETDSQGIYRIDASTAGAGRLVFSLINFASARREVTLPASGSVQIDAVLHLALSADVLVTGQRTFINLADAENPVQNLVGIAQSASQGAITARQLGTRPVMRAGEVLETVPGVIISQHSGEGKANQYYLRGFNLDHGTDFATSVAGMPVNMPTHGHGNGYSDVNFLIPELVGGVQYSKGPYFADQGDFATAGAASINYVNALDRPVFAVDGGGQGFSRVMAAASSNTGGGQLLGALELLHNDGPWTTPDNYRKFNGVIRYSRGDALNGYSLTGMGYRGTWNSTDQVPLRAITEGLIPRFGSLDTTDGGDTYRFSGSFDWQRTHGNNATRLTAYGIGYDLNLFSNFTFFLDDPGHGDQFHQADHRFVSGFKLSHRRLQKWAGFSMQNTAGVQLRNDDISPVGLYHTEARALLDTIRQDSVLQTSAGVYAQNETEWSSRLRTLAGLRIDGYRFRVESSDPVNGGVVRKGIISPKGGVIVGPFGGTEFYGNAGFGFHSNDARGATITRDPVTGAAADRVTPLVRAKGAEVGVRTVAKPHLQSSVSAWSLSLDSELIFVGDAGSTEAGRPSHRYGLEVANYYSPKPWLVFDGDLALSKARFTNADPGGDFIPGSAGTVVSGGVTVEDVRGVFGSVRLRYFGPRPLIEDETVRSKATTMVNLAAGYKLSRRARVTLDVFNLFDAIDSDIDYYSESRLPGEPAEGIADLHLHPVLPRTVRLRLSIALN